MPISIVLSHAHQDRAAAQTLERHLTPMIRAKRITLWHRDWKAADLEGLEPTKECHRHMAAASIILLLISPDLEIECETDLEVALQQRARNARVIPVFYRAVDLSGHWYSTVRMLPDGTAIADRRDKDQAWVDVVQGIRRVVEVLEKQGGAVAAAAPPSPPLAVAPAASAAASPLTPGAPGAPGGASPAVTNNPLTILFLSASPPGSTRTLLDREVREIGDRLHASSGRDRLQLVQAWAATVSDLSQTLLRHKPTIVHFSGEGTPTGDILLNDVAGAPVSVRGEVLAELFRILAARGVRCVVLNANFSAKHAPAIAHYIDSVIGMSDQITDKQAIEFAVGFYTGLAEGSALREAFDLGCVQILINNLPGSDIPKIFPRENVDLSTMRLL